MKDFNFSNQTSGANASSVIDVLREPRLWIPSSQDYPDYDDWLLRTESELAEGSKRAMVARHGGRAIGAVVYQKQDGATLQIKNISISPSAAGRHVGSFMLRNAEIEGSQYDFPGTNSVTVDTKLRNVEMLEFLFTNGYQPEQVTDIYGLGAGADVVLVKEL